jgi:hypothetical protein
VKRERKGCIHEDKETHNSAGVRDTPAAALNKRRLELEEKSAVDKAAFEVAEKNLIEAKVRHNHFLDRSVIGEICDIRRSLVGRRRTE